MKAERQIAIITKIKDDKMCRFIGVTHCAKKIGWLKQYGVHYNARRLTHPTHDTNEFAPPKIALCFAIKILHMHLRFGVKCKYDMRNTVNHCAFRTKQVRGTLQYVAKIC